MLDNGYIDVSEFLSRMVEDIVLEHEMNHSRDTDERSIEHLLRRLKRALPEPDHDSANGYRGNF